MAEEQQSSAGPPKHHVVRDLLLSAVIAGSAGVAPVTPTRVAGGDQMTTRSQPAPERTELENAEAAEYFEIKQEQEQERALEIGTILNAPVQVEQRPDNRDER